MNAGGARLRAACRVVVLTGLCLLVGPMVGWEVAGAVAGGGGLDRRAAVLAWETARLTVDRMVFHAFDLGFAAYHRLGRLLGEDAGPGGGSDAPGSPAGAGASAAASSPAGAGAAAAAGGQGTAAAEALWQHRNLGKAFYENPTTQAQAVEELRQALALAPGSARERLNYGLALLKAGRTAEGVAELERVQRQEPALPHSWFNLGIAAKRASDYDKAVAQFQRMVELVPDEPVSHYNLGVLYKLIGRPEASVAQFETAARLAPQLAGPHFQLFNAYKVLGRGEEAARELALFQEIKKRQAGAAVPEDLEWSFYSELYDPPEDKMAAGLGAGAAAAAPAPPSFEPHELGRGLDPATAGLLVLDLEGDGRPALLAWSAAGIVAWRAGGTGGPAARAATAGPLAGAAAPLAGLEALRGVVFVAAGDFNNDGLPDLCVLTGDGARLYVNRGGGRFEESPARLPAGRFRRAVWLDYDHDYDLDLLLLGDTAALVRNDGTAGWSDHTADFPFAAGKALDAVTFDLIADSQGVDLAVSYQDRPGVLYRDRLGGHFTAEPLPGLPPGARALAAYDFDGDGWTDLAALADGGGAAGPDGVVLLWNRGGQLTAAGALPATAAGGGALAVADLGNRAAPDLVTDRGLFRWQVESAGRGGRFEAAPPPDALLAGGTAADRQAAGTASRPAAAARGLVAAVAADFDRDGREDLAVVRGDGSLAVLRNVSPAAGRWLEVALTGVRNPKLALGARVEVKAGSVYQKKLYRGTPLLFGLRGRQQADTVRITWPNGLIQNETRQAAAAGAGEVRSYKEAQRLSGSCPMVFAWNGKRFEFITDVLGVAPLGASSGDGQYFPVDHDEWVFIPGRALQPSAGGFYEVRITEELREVTYLDRVRLLALDHPAAVEVFTNEKFKSPPFPEFRLFGVERKVHPRRAVDGRGRDQLPALLARDGVYAEGFRHTLSGVAETHALELDFGPAAAPDNRAVLYLAGWVDWADGSTFRAASQESPEGLMLPRLEVRDAAGRWQTAVADMGIPAGKPKTIAVDLTGKFLSASREVRIVTNLCVYWDEVFLGESSSPPPARLTALPAAVADLRFRGFSRPVIDAARRQPEEFDYQHWMAVSSWNPTPGLYTRYGDVRPLLERVDDELVILGSGDELSLRFAGGPGGGGGRGGRLPALPPGWRRDFLLDVDGWAKDADPNTAFSQSVEPLPFHAMSAYPYPDSERFPDDAAHRRWRQAYNTRPALRLLRPLAAAGLEQHMQGEAAESPDGSRRAGAAPGKKSKAVDKGKSMEPAPPAGAGNGAAAWRAGSG